MEIDLLQEIESIRPKVPGMIMDMVADAGIDVTPWYVTKDGVAVKNPRANPSYTYDWAFGGGSEPTALCVWHKSISCSSELIFFEDNLRDLALKLGLIAIDRTKPANVRSRSQSQAKRAQNFDLLLQRAFRKSMPIRVILLEGDDHPEADIGWESSKVKYRLLDPELWYVHSYSDDDGSFRLVRSVALEGAPTTNGEPLATAVFEDQFSTPDPSQKRESKGSSYVRSADVRQAVLNRATGVCECCGAIGFTTSNGAIFLETHHVIPLSEQGPDVEWNVVAICPNDHRRAHFAEDRESIQTNLIARLSNMYPLAGPELQKLMVK